MSIRIREQKTLYCGAVSHKMEVTLVPDDGTDELRAALAVVDRYREVAFAALKVGAEADWTMVDYTVKDDCVTVTIEQGACG
jgi:hypothetical protein